MSDGRGVTASDARLTIALFEPEIPPNTGAIMRLAANTGARLALIEPLGFELSNTRLRRAGLDYRALADTTVYASFEDFKAAVPDERMFAFSARNARRYDAVAYREGDVLLFGPETRGLPDEVLAGFPAERRLRIPMREGSRSLNLANAAAVAVYEAWRQMDFRGVAGGT